jgi:hypothetical protein
MWEPLSLTILWASTACYRNSFTFSSRVRGSMTNNNGFWAEWLDLLALFLQLQSITTAHNQWLPKTRFVFSSTVTDSVLIYESVTTSASGVRWLTLTAEHSTFLRMNHWTPFRTTKQLIHKWTLFHSGRTEYKSPRLTVPLLFYLYPLSRKRVLASRCLALGVSGFQASCHNIHIIIYKIVAYMVIVVCYVYLHTHDGGRNRSKLVVWLI